MTDPIVPHRVLRNRPASRGRTALAAAATTTTALVLGAATAAPAPSVDRASPADRPGIRSDDQVAAGSAVARMLAAGTLGDRRLVFHDWLDDEGELRGGPILLPAAEPLPPQFASAGTEYETIRDHGPPENRSDIVVVGDGFVPAEFAAYADRIEVIVQEFFAAEPFATYRHYFNVHRVDVRSIESGVDNDPVNGIDRDTALDMEYWCQGVERLLCVDTAKAIAFASIAPDADHVWAVANSSKYGGTGYLAENVTTFPTFISTADWLALHEFGHSFAELADEYWTTGASWNGPELPFVNVSILDRFEIPQLERKWWRWIGDDDPFQGEISAYEGAYYHQFGIHRPTPTSRMRSIGQDFNLVAIEALVAQIHREVDVIDGGTPPGLVPAGSMLEVIPMQPVGHDLSVRWFADGTELPDAEDATSLDLAAAGPFAPGTVIEARVVDETEWVRDPAIRNALLTDRRLWTVDAACAGDLDGSGAVDWPDLVGLIEAWGDCAGCAGDLDGDGAIDPDDLALLLAAWGDC